MTEEEESPQSRALALLSADGPDAVLSEPWALAALADPGQWAGDVERALAALPGRVQSAVRRAGRAVVKAGRAEAGAVVPFPGGPPPAPQPAMATPLILTMRGCAWIRLGGRYVPTPTDTAVQELIRAGNDSLQTQTDRGWRPLSWADAYARVGALVVRVVYELGAEADRYDATDGTLYIACGRTDPQLTPQHYPEIHTWLCRMAGDALPRLLDWLVSVWDLQRPTAALYLEGGGGTGKSMLASALQRCWGTSSTTYADVVLGSYSGALIRQPIVWLDERAPEDRGGKGTAAFRSLVGNRSHPYTEKYQASGTIIGCPRLIITSNTDDALRFGQEDLVRADLEAIAVRILHIDVDDAAASYLRGIDTSGWVTTDDGKPGKICQHLAEMHLHYKIERPGRRFLVEGEIGAWLRRQSSQSGLAQDVLVAVVRALTDLRDVEDPVTHEFPARGLVSVAQGHVLVGATDLHRAWPLLSGDRSGRITVARLGRVLRGLAGHVKGHAKGRRHPIDNDLVRDACRSVHGSDAPLFGVLA